MLHITVVDDAETPRPDLSRDYTATELASFEPDVVATGYTFTGGATDQLTGVSIATIISDMRLPSNVDSVAFSCPGIPAPSALSAAAGDLADPATFQGPYPFESGLPPLFAPYTTGASHNFVFAVERRNVEDRNSTLTDGREGFADPANPMTMTLTMGALRLTPHAHASPDTVTTSETVDFTAILTDPDTSATHTWTWTFGDGAGASTSSARHAFSAPGDFTATVSVTSSSGASGSTSVTVHVRGATTTPTKPTTAPGPTHGAGQSTAPTAGPVTGTGPRVGGDATGRGGAGSAGPSLDPRSATGVADADGAVVIEGNVVGYLLSNADGAVKNPQAAVVPRNNSAPAARDGDESIRLSGWIIAVVAVVALLALGAGSERRRPTFTRARRKQ